ncbi:MULTISPECIES: hypothetical protein [Streptomyces]|uniref:Uncharacterized protein n=1 Tax=Streptomyces canarius TaxID=285453 RepID=A0ABQ3CWE9_9ACTN|nr:hypothetical protein [Streptomyces canarius]GHA46476.1 hypothetical protein GCM10010345_58760 [Streptomyces canarius]
MCAGLGDSPILLTVADDAGADAENATARTALKDPLRTPAFAPTPPGGTARLLTAPLLVGRSGRAGRFPTLVESSVRMRGGTAADALTGRVVRVGTPDSRRP